MEIRRGARTHERMPGDGRVVWEGHTRPPCRTCTPEIMKGIPDEHFIGELKTAADAMQTPSARCLSLSRPFEQPRKTVPRLL